MGQYRILPLALRHEKMEGIILKERRVYILFLRLSSSHHVMRTPVRVQLGKILFYFVNQFLSRRRGNFTAGFYITSTDHKFIVNATHGSLLGELF